MARLGALLMLVLSWSPAAAQEAAVVIGRVMDDYGRPIAGAEVQVLGSALGALTDLTGTARLTIPPGEHVLRARVIGYEWGVDFLKIAAGDSAGIEFRLPQTAITLGGADWPLAPEDLHAEGAALIGALLSDSVTEDFLRRYGFGPEDSPVLVWTPWIDHPRTIRRGGRSFLLTPLCEGCSAENAINVEGSPIYTARLPHLRLGLTAPGIRTPVLTLCLGIALPGERLMPNCVGGRGARRVTYARDPDGEWVQIPVDQLHHQSSA